jgi:hypothetical protein
MKEVGQNACHHCIVYNASFIQYDISKKAELDLECLCFHEFPEWRFECKEAEVKHWDLRGDFQQSQPTCYK